MNRFNLLLKSTFTLAFLFPVLLSFSSTSQLPTNESKQSNDDSIPIYPDLVYEYRIAELNKLTPIELEYNKYVRRYIDVYTIERRQHMAKIAGRAAFYFPLFEEKLDKYNLPLELKYLAIVESALDPFARSSSGALGLWQFKMHSSRMFNLEISSYIDERRDPYKSTEAACKYLQYLYRTYNDWQLALAAYNGGPGVVRKAIERSGGKKTFWELYPYLPDQTKGYVPAFIAVNYAMNYLKEHDIKPIKQELNFFDTDTLKINYKTTFKIISQRLNVPVSKLRQLNPVYKRDVIPNKPEPSLLILPKDKIVTFLKNEDEIYKQVALADNDSTEVDMPPRNANKKKLVHIVKKGEYFHKIAMIYNCTIEEIREWNNLENNDLSVGQRLNIWVDPAYVEQIQAEKLKMQKRLEADTNKRVVYYTVQQGDTIWSIANKFNCDSVAELLKTNDIQDETDVKPGKKLKIYLNH